MAAAVFQNDPVKLKRLIFALNADQAVTYTALATIAIVYLDYFITLPREIELMWNKKFTIPKVLYFILKYWVMAHSVLWMSLNMDPNQTGHACNGPFNRNGVSCQIILTLAEAVSYYRVYAFSGKNKYVGAFFGFLYVAYVAVGFYFVPKFLSTVEFFDLPGEGLGCLSAKGNGFPLFVAAVGLVIGLTSATGAMIAIGFRRRKAMLGPNKLLRVFYQDGIFYFVSLFILAVLNIGIFLGAGPGRQLLFIQPLVNFSAILSSRMILHLRQWSAKQQIIAYSHNASTGERWVAQDTTFRQESFHSNQDGEYMLRNLVFKSDHRGHRT